MENNNRQGCRWTLNKLLEWMKTEEFKDALSGIEKVQSLLDESESIEPCATPNYWKQRCEAAEDVIRYHVPYQYNEDFYKRWQEIKSKTPSPTGDRDCEELKKEVERLKGFMAELHDLLYANKNDEALVKLNHFVLNNL